MIFKDEFEIVRRKYQRMILITILKILSISLTNILLGIIKYS